MKKDIVQPSIVEVSFGVSKTVQKNRFEPVKLFSSIVVANVVDVKTASQVLFPLIERQIDAEFHRLELGDAPVTETKREIIEPGKGEKGTALERRQERRSPEPNPEDDSIVPEEENSPTEPKTPEEFSEQREHNFKRVDADPEGWRKVEELLERLKENDGENYPKSIAHTKFLRRKEAISHDEMNLLLEWADVLQLPERKTAKQERRSVPELVAEEEIHSYEDIGRLRWNKKISYMEMIDLKGAHAQDGESIFGEVSA